MRRRVFPNFIGDVAEIEERQERMERVMQMLGVTPEFPFTMNVNDGTFNRVRIGLIGADYGIEIVDNAGNNILLANGTIVADAIKTGTLDCDLLNVINLDAGSITTGTLSADLIVGGILNCGTLTVANLSATVITTGTFLSPNDRFADDSLSGVKISGNTIAASKITANSINSDQIQSHGISADRLNVLTLSTITANCGTLTAGTIDADTVNVTHLNAANLNKGTLSVGYSGQPTQIYIRRNGSNGYINWEGGSKVWCDNSQYMGYDSVGGRHYFNNNGANMLILQYSVSRLNTGLDIYGGLYVDNNFRVGGELSGNLNCGNRYLTNCNTMWVTVINNTTINNTTLYGNTIWYWNLNYYSDEKLKKNIKALSSNLASVLSLTPKEFQYKTDKEEKRRFGFMASEVEEILPELVSTDDKGNKGIDITEMIPLLVGAIKELKKEVELLKEKGGV